MDVFSHLLFREGSQEGKTWAALHAVFSFSGATDRHIVELGFSLRTAFIHGGTRSFSTLIKGWQKATRSILAREFYDASDVGLCKRIRNHLHLMREEGITDSAIALLIDTYKDLGGIPPFLLWHEFHGGLLPNASVDAKVAIAHLSNIGRTAPEGNFCALVKSVSNFRASVTRRWEHSFSFFKVGLSIGRSAAICRGLRTRVKAGRNSCLKYPRQLGGKNAELLTEIMNDFCQLSIDQIVTWEPTGDVYDITGNLFLRQSDWGVGVDAAMVIYPDIRLGVPELFSVMGYIVLLWAIRKLIQLPGIITHHAGMVWPGLGYGKPYIRVEGYVSARVEPIPEEGWKIRVISVTEYCVAVIGMAARHLLDPLIWADKMADIGLRSPVKLYSILRKLSLGETKGLSSNLWSFGADGFADSVDLTTATDTPPLKGVSTFLRGITESWAGHPAYEFLTLACDVGNLPRSFLIKDQPTIPWWFHLCGIMMGEGLSGIFLNGMSMFLRSQIDRFITIVMGLYHGSTVRDADNFIAGHHELIQTFLDDTPDVIQYSEFSSQSGDDGILFGVSRRRFLILLYRVMGFEPSQTTFYSSEYYATFTEETCLKTECSNGWRFIDTFKPRLARPAYGLDGIASLLSRISQIRNRLRYQRNEVEIERACFVVDLMIQANPVLRDRAIRYDLPLGLPSWLGGIDHPMGLSNNYVVELLGPEVQRVISFFETAPVEVVMLAKFAYLWDSSDDECSQEIKEVLMNLFNLVSGMDVVTERPDGDQWVALAKTAFCPRDIMGFVQWSKIVETMSSNEGYTTFSKVATKVASAIRLRQLLDGHTIEEKKNPLIQLRDRAQKLRAVIPLRFHSDGVSSTSIWNAEKRLRFLDDKYIKEADVLDLIGCGDLPSFSILFQH